MADFEEIEESIIETIDENGEKVKFELIDIIEVDDQEYGILYPIKDEESEEAQEDDEEYDEDEVLAMRLIREDDEYIFEYIEDDDEFNKVLEYVESLKEDLP